MGQFSRRLVHDGVIEGMSVVRSTWRMKKGAHVDHYIRNNNIKADGAKMNGVIAHSSKEIGHTKKNKSDKNIFMKSVCFFLQQKEKTGKWTNLKKQKQKTKNKTGRTGEAVWRSENTERFPKRKATGRIWLASISISWPRILYTSTNL